MDVRLQVREGGGVGGGEERSMRLANPNKHFIPNNLELIRRFAPITVVPSIHDYDEKAAGKSKR